MTAIDDDAAIRLLTDYRYAGGCGNTIPDISAQLDSTPEIVAVLAGWLAELETRWPGPETEGRGLARLCLANALGCKEARKSDAVPALISQFDTAKTINPLTLWAAGNALCVILLNPVFSISSPRSPLIARSEWPVKW